MKMYCIFSKESIKKMNGNRGKMAAQAGHAYLHAFWDAEARSANSPDRWAPPAELSSAPIYAYKYSGSAKKVCLVVDTDEDLKALYEAYKPICGVSLVVDAGLTCFGGVPTITCLGIGPISDEQIGENLSSLKVLI